MNIVQRVATGLNHLARHGLLLPGAWCAAMGLAWTPLLDVAIAIWRCAVEGSNIASTMMFSYDLAARYGPALGLGLAFGAALGVPIPAFVSLMLVGAATALAALDGSTLWSSMSVVLATTVFGGVMGDLVWFHAGRRYGDRTLKTICMLTMSRDSCVKTTERFYERWGARTIFVARFIPGLSLITVPLAGAMNVPARAFLWRDAAGVALWSGAALLFGWLFAPQLDAVLSAASHAGRQALIAAAVLVPCFVLYRHWRRQTLLNIAKNHRITVHQLFELMARDPALRFFDIRSTEKRLIDPFVIEGSILADESDMPTLMQAIGPTRHPVIYCSCPNDVSAATTALALRQNGLRGAVALAGGLDAWRKAGRKLVHLALPARTYTRG